MDIVTLTLGGVCLSLLLFYRKRKRNLDIIRQIGVPGPPNPHWFFGSILLPKNRFEQIEKWTKKYGQIYGFYEGPKPWVVTTDLDFIQEVMIKQFSCFHAREEFPIQPEENQTLHLFFARGAVWKRLRNIVNPTFSSSKLRQVSTLMKPKLDQLLANIQRLSDTKQPVEIQDVYQKLTMDVIADVAFGISLEAQSKTEEEKFLKECRASFNAIEERDIVYKFATLFPELRRFLFWFIVSVVSRVIHSPDDWIINKFGDIVRFRRENKIERQDLLQLMMDAVANTDTKSGDASAGGHLHLPAMLNVRKTLTDAELQYQSYLFMLAGYETSSNVLMYLTYLLALNQDKHDILTQEIDTHITKESDVTYDLVMKLPYLDMCITEALRIYPVGAGAVTRTCTDPCTIQGLHIPRGVMIQADVWSIHHDPELYPKPWKYEPERFSPENKARHHPMQYLAFGAGPRNCVGMRFGLMEIKMAMVHLLRRFRFERSEKTEEPLKLKEAATISAANGVYVNVIPRTEQ